MGLDPTQPPSGLPGPPQPASDPWWWIPNAFIAAAGVALVALGVFSGVRTDELVTTGIALVVGAAGHAAGKQSPTP